MRAELPMHFDQMTPVLPPTSYASRLCQHLKLQGDLGLKLENMCQHHLLKIDSLLRSHLRLFYFLFFLPDSAPPRPPAYRARPPAYRHRGEQNKKRCVPVLA